MCTRHRTGAERLFLILAKLLPLLHPQCQGRAQLSSGLPIVDQVHNCGTVPQILNVQEMLNIEHLPYPISPGSCGLAGFAYERKRRRPRVEVPQPLRYLSSFTAP